MYAMMQRVVVNVEMPHTLLCSYILLSIPWGKSVFMDNGPSYSVQSTLKINPEAPSWTKRYVLAARILDLTLMNVIECSWVNLCCNQMVTETVFRKNGM
jgi:hypothetical protein